MLLVAASPTALSGPAPQVRPVTVLAWALLLLCVGNLGRIPLLDSGAYTAPVLVNDLAVGLVLVAAALACVQSRSLELDGVAMAALAFAAVGGLSALSAAHTFGLSAHQLVVSLAYLARWLMYFGIYVVVVNWARADDVPRLWRTLENTLLALAAFGLLQTILLPGFAQMVSPNGNWDEQGYRLVSTILDPNIMGAMFTIGVLVQLSLLASGARVPRWKPLVLVLALALTLSRSAVLGLLFGGLAIFICRGMSRRLVRLAVFIATLLILALPAIIRFGNMYHKFDTGGSAAVRLVTLALALTTFAQHPVWGIGFNTWGYVAGMTGAHALGPAAFSGDGGLLFVAVMTGVVGLSLYCGMLWLIAARSRRIWRHPAASPQDRGFAIGAVAVTVGIVVDSIFINTLLTTFVMELLWVVWGFGYVLHHRVMQRERARGAPRDERPAATPAPRLVQLGTAS